MKEIRRKRAVAIVGALALFAAFAAWQAEFRDVSAQNAQTQVTIGNSQPTISNVRCCFTNTGLPFVDSGCKDPGGSYTISEATNYDIVCNLTVSDANGWQDLSDGWVNATWHHADMAAYGPLDYDFRYVNSSCASVAGSGNGNDIDYQCAFSNIRYWANAGQWTLSASSHDGTSAGPQSNSGFVISNVTTLWQSSSISFGSMGLGETGSQGNTGRADVPSITNNTGNTRINLEVQSLTAAMGCAIGNISLDSIRYDISAANIDTACGRLNTTSYGGCTKIQLPDCSGACSAQSTATTYWGIIIPPSGVGGSCNLQMTFTAVQG
jgi:hypothetical protein